MQLFNKKLRCKVVRAADFELRSLKPRARANNTLHTVFYTYYFYLMCSFSLWNSFNVIITPLLSALGLRPQLLSHGTCEPVSAQGVTPLAGQSWVHLSHSSALGKSSSYSNVIKEIQAAVVQHRVFYAHSSSITGNCWRGVLNSQGL